MEDLSGLMMLTKINQLLELLQEHQLKFPLLQKIILLRYTLMLDISLTDCFLSPWRPKTQLKHMDSLAEEFMVLGLMQLLQDAVEWSTLPELPRLWMDLNFFPLWNLLGSVHN